MNVPLNRNDAASAAAHWWGKHFTDALNRLRQDPYSKHLVSGVTDEQAVAFQTELVGAIEGFLEEDNWSPQNPQGGAYFRVLGVEYSPDPPIEETLKRAGIPSAAGNMILGWKIKMHIDPNRIVVFFTETGGKIQVYPPEELPT